MALSVVNGFLCFNSCDVKKALQGKNPHPKPPTPHAPVNRADQPAVLYGGNLNQARGSAIAVAPASASSQTDLSDQYTPVDVTA